MYLDFIHIKLQKTLVYPAVLHTYSIKILSMSAKRYVKNFKFIIEFFIYNTSVSNYVEI